MYPQSKVKLAHKKIRINNNRKIKIIKVIKIFNILYLISNLQKVKNIYRKIITLIHKNHLKILNIIILKKQISKFIYKIRKFRITPRKIII